jgi:hypothetical protein
VSITVAVPIFAAIGGAFVGWLASFTNERAKWRRERVARWDERRLTAFIGYSSAVKRQVHLCLRLAASNNLGTMDVGTLDAAKGLPLLEAADARRAELFEGLLLLADKPTITAARRWQEAVWKLHETVNGTRTVNQRTFMSLFGTAGKARDKFYRVARSSLSVEGSFVSGGHFEVNGGNQPRKRLWRRG